MPLTELLSAESGIQSGSISIYTNLRWAVSSNLWVFCRYPSPRNCPFSSSSEQYGIDSAKAEPVVKTVPWIRYYQIFWRFDLGTLSPETLLASSE
jgi:hypothetical protein